MQKLFAVACGLAILAGTVRAANPTTQAIARSGAIAADLDHFILEIKYHGAQDKPHYNLTLKANQVIERALELDQQAPRPVR
jgi:hypothetical protein